MRAAKSCVSNIVPTIKTPHVATASLRALAAHLNAQDISTAWQGRVSAAPGQRLAARLKKYVRAKAAAKEWDPLFLPDYLARSPQFKGLWRSVLPNSG
jgi:TorA maturation chaperone TorD